MFAKARKGLFPGDKMIFLCQGLIAAKDAVQNYIAQKTSLLLDAVALVLMMRCRVLSCVHRTLTVCALRSYAQNAARIWGMCSKAKV